MRVHPGTAGARSAPGSVTLVSPLKTSLSGFCLLWLLSLSAAADWTTARSESELCQGLQNLEWSGQTYRCYTIHIEGDWALAQMQRVGGSDGSAMFQRRNGRWTRHSLLGGRGPLVRADLLRAKVPESVAASFGYGRVEPSVSKAFRELAVQRSAESLTLATHHQKVLGSLHFASYSSIYKYHEGSWQPVFDYHGSVSKGLQPFTRHGFSLYLGGCIQEGTAGRIVLKP